MSLRPALFLDRDGVVIDDSHYVGSVDQIRWIPGSAAAVRKANDAGFAIVVVSNQSGVARGLFSEADVEVIHEHIRQHFLAESGATFDRFYFCPHHETEGGERYRIDCDCRKPKPGMLLRAARELDLDLEASWLIGDRLSDMQAGIAAGCRTILVRTGYGKNVELSEGSPSLVCADLAEAVDRILSNY
jgi:D-glycero-D-manno-heptose 1,7-bisphosphate phosphatase